jgi:hypothetical protein
MTPGGRQLGYRPCRLPAHSLVKAHEWRWQATEFDAYDRV